MIKYLDQHADIKSVFWRRGGRPRTARLLKQHSAKFFGNFIFDNRYELMNKASSFPGDVWRLAEERVLESIAWLDRVEAIGPRRHEHDFELTEEEAKIWASGAYNQGHLFHVAVSSDRTVPVFRRRLSGDSKEMERAAANQSQRRFRRHQ